MESPENSRLRLRKSQESPMKWKSSMGGFHESPKSSLLFTAQARSYEKKIKSIRRITNPFEPEDPMILEENTCSPGVLVPGPEPEEFSWSIEEISKIQPAAIDSPQLPLEEYDESKESLVQEAIQKYFLSTHSILSPEDAYQGTWRSPAFSTPTAPSSAKTISSTPTAKSRIVSKREVGVQTTYSFPAVLPTEIEDLLKPYLLDLDQQNVSLDSEDSSLLNTSTLRRKLFFNKDDEDLSPVKFNTHHHYTPSPQKTNVRSRIDWSTEKCRLGDESVPSSPDLSPIRIKPTDADMSLSSPDLSAISNAEVSMVTVDSLKCPDEIEDMTVSIDDHNRIFSSTVVTNKEERFLGGASGSIESSGYGTISSYDASVNNFRPNDFGC